MSNPSFVDFFLDSSDEDLNFELSSRGGINFKKVSEKLQNLKLEPFIIDISLNVYTTSEAFDFAIDNKLWSSVKSNFEKGSLAQKNPEALTVKRAIRLCARDTTKYIRKRNVKTNLHKYMDILPMEYAHLGGHFVVDKSNAFNLLKLWQNFDNNKGTKVSDSILRVLSLRFPDIFVNYKLSNM